MNKFVFLSFAFLAWAFYELSGGADFAPPPKVVASKTVDTGDTVVTKTKVASSTNVEKRVVARNITPIEPTRAKTSGGIEYTKVEPATLASVLSEAPTPVASQTVTSETAILDTAEDFGVPRNVDADTQDTPTIIPSLITASAEAPSPATFEAVATSDMRVVSGNRVNVRGGPGTGFAVIDGLVRGETVEVLQDEGGWVRLRLNDGVSEGWVAASLLTKN